MRASTVALLIDLQDGFIGAESPFRLSGIEQLIASVRRMVAWLRHHKIPIIWTRVYLDDWTHSPYSQLWPQHFDACGKAAFLRRGSASHAIVTELRDLIDDDDILLDKPRYSAFIGTSLAETLRRLEATDLLFAGVSTNVCVESTLRDAFQIGFRCTLVRDCTLTFDKDLQECAERVISLVFGQVVDLDLLSEPERSLAAAELEPAEP